MGHVSRILTQLHCQVSTISDWFCSLQPPDGDEFSSNFEQLEPSEAVDEQELAAASQEADSGTLEALFEVASQAQAHITSTMRAVAVTESSPLPSQPATVAVDMSAARDVAWCHKCSCAISRKEVG